MQLIVDMKRNQGADAPRSPDETIRSRRWRKAHGKALILKRERPLLGKYAVAVALLLVLGLGSTVSADEPAKTTVDATSGAKDLKPKNETTPTTKTNVVEPFNPETVAAPLRALIAAIAPAPAAPKRNLRANNGAVAMQAVAQNDAMVQQSLQQLRPVMIAELEFVRLVCSDLTPEQRKKIKSSALRALKEAAQAMAAPHNGQQVRVAVGVGVRAKSATEPRSILRDAITQALQETLPEERMSLYSVAANQRIEKRKQTAILAVVSRLDEQLYLSIEQRDRISAAIASKWQPGWEKWTQMVSMRNWHFFPMIPDELVAPSLNDAQKAVWRVIPKNNQNIMWHNHQVQAAENDEWWGADGENDGDAKPAALEIQVIEAEVIEEPFE